MTPADAIVVGGGLAGLTAARDLRDAGLDVVVVEAGDRLGGRTYAVDVDGDQLELGGTWIIPAESPAMMAELERYGLGIEETPRPDRFVTVLGGRATAGAGPDPSDLEDVCAALDHERSALDSRTLDEVLQEAAVSGPGLEWVRAFCRYLNGADLHEVSASPFAGVRPGDLLDVDHYTHTIGGTTNALVEALATDLSVRLGSRVSSVRGGTGSVEVALEDGTAMTARSAVLATPLNTWSDLAVDPPLRSPDLVASGHAGRSCKLWLRVTGVHERVRAVDDTGPFAYLRVDRVLPERGEALVAAFGLADVLGRMSHDEIAGALRQLLPGAELVTVTSHDWIADPLSRGTWLALRPGQRGPIERLTSGHPRLLLAGADLAADAFASMEGAVRSGRRAAEAVQDLLAHG